jgi:hypothetical protein
MAIVPAATDLDRFERLVDARPGDFAIPQSVVAAGGVAQPRRRGCRASSRPRKT